MKKEKLTTRIKDWVKDYYSFVMEDLKTSKSMNILSWMLLATCSTAMFASLSLYGAGTAFIISAFAVAAEMSDCVVNFNMGNTSSYLARGFMAVCATAFMPIMAVADVIVDRVEAKKEKEVFDEKLTEEEFESINSANFQSENVETKDVTSSHNISARGVYNTELKNNLNVQNNNNENNIISPSSDLNNNGNDGNDGM